jgi:hypothetical protein
MLLGLFTHNIGFTTLELLSQSTNNEWNKMKYFYDVLTCTNLVNWKEHPFKEMMLSFNANTIK